MPSLKKTKEEAWKFYDAWRKTGSYCQAFHSRVVISLKGWRHITGATGYKKRSYDDTYRRLMLLPHAKMITEQSTTIQNITHKNGNEYHILEALVSVKEKGVTAMRKVRVVFLYDKKKNRIFLSVMDKKQKLGF
jgi:hypothetical protein